MNGLVEFLRARFDEDEARALAAKVTMLGDVWRVQQRRDGLVDVMAAHPRTAIVATELSPEEGEHIAAHDPARVLADVASKRRLLDQFRLRGNSVRAAVQPSTGGVWDDLLRMLAMPYAGHPDYRREWAP